MARLTGTTILRESIRAAMIYQHATRDRDQAIAKALGTFVPDARGTKEDSTEGPERGEQGP
jgi:hypothetical protein